MTLVSKVATAHRGATVDQVDPLTKTGVIRSVQARLSRSVRTGRGPTHPERVSGAADDDEVQVVVQVTPRACDVDDDGVRAEAGRHRLSYLSGVSE